MHQFYDILKGIRANNNDLLFFAPIGPPVVNWIISSSLNVRAPNQYIYIYVYKFLTYIHTNQRHTDRHARAVCVTIVDSGSHTRLISSVRHQLPKARGAIDQLPRLVFIRKLTNWYMQIARNSSRTICCASVLSGQNKMLPADISFHTSHSRPHVNILY